MTRFRRVNWRHFLADSVLITVSLYTSLLIRLDWSSFFDKASILTNYLAIFLFLRLVTMILLGVYDIIWRYVSIADSIKVVRATFISTFFIIAASYLLEMGKLPRSFYFIDLCLSTLLLSGARVTRRILFERSSSIKNKKLKRRALIIGAGTNGRGLATRFHTDSDMGIETLGFIDDDPRKVGRMIGGIKVLGTRAHLIELIRDYQINEVVVAMSSPSGDLLREVFQACRPFHIKPRLIGNVSTQFRGGSRLDILREVALEDLLSRPTRQINFGALQKLIENKKILITGAGGSIGGELARQVLALHPSKLLLLDHSEYNLYKIDHELRVENGDNTVVEPLLIDVKDRSQLESAMREHRPEIVFHAAAYKHVHLVEANPFSSILNNVLGTKNLIDLSLEVGVQNFTLISTDKAVNPAGVMGATKRICELMVSNAPKNSSQIFCAVRFGNVLGSSGSLIPLLKKQISNGEPVTITHEDMARYFMLIPEAVSLVLNASTIAKSGDILILKMGQPIKIVDITRSLIAIMGKNETDVPIVFTGMRPGEKLVEELYLCGNEIVTDHPDILIAPKGDSLSESQIDFSKKVDKLIELAQNSNNEALYQLSSMIQTNTNKDRSENTLNIFDLKKNKIVFN